MTAHTAKAAAADDQAPCPACQGAGAVLMSLCCGRGCATCPGDGMFQNVPCHRCAATGRLPPGPDLPRQTG